MAKNLHSIVVGNIGNIVRDGTWSEAHVAYNEYKKQSNSGHGRASGESVTWFKNGEIYMEFLGKQKRKRCQQ